VLIQSLTLIFGPMLLSTLMKRLGWEPHYRMLEDYVSAYFFWPWTLFFGYCLTKNHREEWWKRPAVITTWLLWLYLLLNFLPELTTLQFITFVVLGYPLVWMMLILLTFFGMLMLSGI